MRILLRKCRSGSWLKAGTEKEDATRSRSWLRAGTEKEDATRSGSWLRAGTEKEEDATWRTGGRNGVQGWKRNEALRPRVKAGVGAGTNQTAGKAQ